MSEPPFRILPRLTDCNRFFWTGGADGTLRFLRCADDGTWIHPPTPICPRCHGKHLRPEPVSGRAAVTTFTVNHQPWMPGPDVPFVLAIVEFPEQDGLRLTTNIVDCPVDAVHVGMPVRVSFERHDDDPDPVYIPLFVPDADAGDGAR